MDGGEDVLEEILKKIPRPNYAELRPMYDELDDMARRAGRALMRSGLFERGSLLIRFDRATRDDIISIIKKDPDVMVPFFVMVCGFSDRELERLYGISNVYSLRGKAGQKKLEAFAQAVVDNLRHPLHLETIIYKFYKNWEEHQKRHYRGRVAEYFVREVLERHGYEAGKVRVNCKGKEREIDVAVPPRSSDLRVAIQVRQGVSKDLIKRAKEFSSEFDELMECYPNAKFVVVYFVSPHEKNRIGEIYSKIASEREGKRPYDLVILRPEEVEEKLVPKLEEWGVPKAAGGLLSYMRDRAGSAGSQDVGRKTQG